MKKRIVLLGLLILAATAAGIFIYPANWGNKILPWRLGLDIVGGTSLTYDIDLSEIKEADRESTASGLRDVIEKRVNLFGVSEPQVNVARSGDNYRLIVELAGVNNAEEAIREIGLTPLLDFREVSYSEGDENIYFIPTGFTGKYITNAQIGFDQITGAPHVNLQFNDEGATLFAELTEKNVGKEIAVFLDNEPVQVATVREKIPDGRAVLSGNFTRAEALKIVERFNAGALPAPINLVSQRTVGASLGQEFLNKAVMAGAIGTLVVMIFMVVFYGLPGVVSSIALLLYVIFSLSVFKLIGATMSLAAIAGFILSIGMAVDANILIFERMREERKKGLSKASAVEEGFRRAWSSIMDANVTTVIAAIVLYIMTTSFIKGFALTLGLGVLVSMFSAISITRLLLKSIYRK